MYICMKCGTPLQLVAANTVEPTVAQPIRSLDEPVSPVGPRITRHALIALNTQDALDGLQTGAPRHDVYRVVDGQRIAEGTCLPRGMSGVERHYQ